MFFNERTKISDALDPHKSGCGLVELLGQRFDEVIEQPEKSMDDIINILQNCEGSQIDEYQLQDLVGGL